jgi:hypothetical protein
LVTVIAAEGEVTVCRRRWKREKRKRKEGF